MTLNINKPKKHGNNYNYYFFYKNGNVNIDFCKKEWFFRHSKKHIRKIGNNGFEMDKKNFKYNHFSNNRLYGYKNFRNQFYMFSDGTIVNKTILNKSILKRLQKYIL